MSISNVVCFLNVDGYAPFLSMTTRETFLDVGDSVMAAPGPGQYEPAIISERVKGGSTLANRVSVVHIFCKVQVPYFLN